MQVVQQQLVSAFISLMSEHGIRKYVGIQTRSSQYAVGHDKAVHQNDHAQLCRTQHATYCHHHLKSSETTQDFFYRMLAREMLKSLLKYPKLMGHGFSIQSATGSHALFQWNTRQATHPQGRSGGVSYSHFAETHHVTTCGLNTVYTLRSTLQTQIHFLGCHGIFVKEITCTATDFHINDAFFVGQVVIHSCINDFQAESMLTAQKVDTSSSVQEITDLLPGNLFRRSTDLLFHNAVVGCEKQVIRIVQRRRQGLLYHTNLQGQFLQTS